MDHDTYSAHDAIGKVYICLNTLVDGGSQVNVLDGWFPIFDTLHGVCVCVSVYACVCECVCVCVCMHVVPYL